MLESNLIAGNQKISGDMTYGQSVTDGCIDWNETQGLLEEAFETLEL
jgi:3-deoxy-7-phosphoheptulonate synthase